MSKLSYFNNKKDGCNKPQCNYRHDYKICHFFQKNNCKNEHCSYLHVCIDFACGVCKKDNCNLPHLLPPTLYYPTSQQYYIPNPYFLPPIQKNNKNLSKKYFRSNNIDISNSNNFPPLK